MSRFPEFTPLVFESDSPNLLLGVLVLSLLCLFLPSRWARIIGQRVPGVVFTLTLVVIAVTTVPLNFEHGQSIQQKGVLAIQVHSDPTLASRAETSNSYSIRTKVTEYLKIRPVTEGQFVRFHPDANVNLTRLLHYAGAASAATGIAPHPGEIWIGTNTPFGTAP